MNINAVSEIDYARDAQTCTISEFLGRFGDGLALEQDFVILLNMNDVGVESRDSHVGMMLAFISNHCDIELFLAADVFHCDRGGGEIFLGLYLLFRRHVGNHFESFFRVSGDDTHCHGGFDAFHAVGVRYNHAFHVFYDVSACKDLNSVWNST